MGTVTEIVRKAEDRQDVSWATIKGWNVDRQESERRIADALQVKLDKLGEKEWLAQRKKEMGWGERAAYYHLRPETLAKKREGDKARQAAARVVQVEPEPVEPEPVKDWTKIDGFGRTIKTPPNQPADGLTTLLDGFNQSLTTLEWNMKRPIRPTQKLAAIRGSEPRSSRSWRGADDPMRAHQARDLSHAYPNEILRECRVAQIDRELALPLLEQYEWLAFTGKGSAAGRAQVFYGLLYGDELLGVEAFGLPAPVSRGVCGPAYAASAIALERGACTPKAPRGAPSFLIRRACIQAHKDKGWEIVFAYADPAAGEVGALYQMLGWLYVGQGVGRKPKPGIEPPWRWRYTRGAKSITSKAMCSRYGPGVGAHARAIADGWEFVREVDRHKFVTFLGPRKAELRAALQYPILAPPKRDVFKEAA